MNLYLHEIERKGRLTINHAIVFSLQFSKPA